MKDVADLIRALTGIAWPVVIAVLLWRLYPTIVKLVSSRGFTVKVGPAELTVQEASDQMIRSTAAIQEELAAFVRGNQKQGQEAVQGADGEAPRRPVLQQVLWVDDVPQNNAYEVAQLSSLGIKVVQARSTEEGLRALDRGDVVFDAAISDLGRSEEGGYDPDAGLRFIREVHSRRLRVPIFIYSTRKALGR